MAYSGIRNIGRWSVGALCAAMLSLAYARASQMPHPEAHASPGAMHGGYGALSSPRPFPHADRGHRRSRAYGAPNRGAMPERNLRIAGGGYGAPWALGARAANGQPPSAAYPGPLRPVSTEARPVPRQEGNAPFVRGSIRAAVARYNEERGASHSVPHAPDEARHPPEPSPYRN